MVRGGIINSTVNINSDEFAGPHRRANLRGQVLHDVVKSSQKASKAWVVRAGDFSMSAAVATDRPSHLWMCRCQR